MLPCFLSPCLCPCHATATVRTTREQRSIVFSRLGATAGSTGVWERYSCCGAGTLSANDELLTDFEEQLQKYEIEVRTQRRGADAARSAAADPTVDLTADAHDGFSGGYGVRHGPGREGAATGTAGAQAADLALELNTHAAAVLDVGGAPGAEPGTLEAGRQEMHKRALSGLEDLRPAQVLPQHCCL